MLFFTDQILSQETTRIGKSISTTVTSINRRTFILLHLLGADRELAFRQESNFYWLSGCDVPGSVVTISYLHDGKASQSQRDIHLELEVEADNPLDDDRSSTKTR
jgi:hypothetical protein